MTPFQVEKTFDQFLHQQWEFPEITAVRWTGDDAPNLPYIEPHLKFGNTFGLEINGVAERVGVLFINIFTRSDVNNREGFAYGGRLEKLFWHRRFENGIVCEDGALMPSTQKIGLDKARQALHFQTQIPFSIIMEY